MSPHRPAPHRAVLVLSALAALGSGAFTACAAGNEEELGQNGPATSSSSSSGEGGTHTTSSASGGDGGGQAGAGQGGGVGGEGGAATGGAGGGQGGSGGTASGGGGQGGAGGQAATGTVLLAPPSPRAEENSDAIGGALDTDPSSGECSGGECGTPPPPSATQADASGYTIVKLEPGRLVPGAPVVVANITRGNSAIGYARVDGGASIPITASSGDALDVFGVDIGTNGGGEATRIVVP